TSAADAAADGTPDAAGADPWSRSSVAMLIASTLVIPKSPAPAARTANGPPQPISSTVGDRRLVSLDHHRTGSAVLPVRRDHRDDGQRQEPGQPRRDDQVGRGRRADV